MTTQIEVGKPYPQPDSVLGEPSAGWHHVGGPMILLAEPGMTPTHAKTLWDGARLWLVGSGPLLVIVPKMPNGDELEMPGARLDGDPLPAWATDPATSATRLAFTFVTVDSTSGITAGLKVATVSPHFTQALAREARDRWQTPISPADFMAAVTEHQTRYSTIKAMLRDAVASTKIGD